MAKFTDQVSAFVHQVNGVLMKDQKKAIRKALNEGAKVVEQHIKPQAPLLESSTNFRQRGTIKNNIRHKTKVRKDGQSGFTMIRVMRTQKRRMSRVGENTRDRTDPFYWWLLEYGTKKMEARPFMEKGFKESKQAATEKAKEVYFSEMKKAVQSK
ncbi:HK97-gp10 family putative phage morphogenesis protein [Testudinibacter sp. P27/CKL/0425]